MKKILLLSILLVISAGALAQTYRISYTYSFNRYFDDGSSRNYQYPDMKLDVGDGKAVWYNEKTFQWDSLKVLAFDRAGDIKDQEKYGELTRMRSGTHCITFIDFNEMKFTQSRRYIMVGYINGEGDLEMPQWEITDETEVSNTGYTVRKAVADYLGREWTAWYTEEIPLPYGPRLFWGLPGLIIRVSDANEDFVFQFTGIEERESSDKYRTLWDRRHTTNRDDRHDQVYDLSIEDAEKMYTRLQSDAAYATEMTGITDLGGQDQYGNPLPNLLYNPLIPSKYWKGRASSVSAPLRPVSP